MEKRLNPTLWTEPERERFIAGWESAGGYTGDIDGPAPWCAPWCYTEKIEVSGANFYEYGADYWRQCSDEVQRLLEEENGDR